MPFCGFNQEMLEGMEAFHEGLVETVLNKPSVEEVKEERALRRSK